MHNATAVVAIEAPIAARQSIQVGWLLRLPYPLRNALGRWRTLVSMVLGVGIALSIGMTLLAVISAEMDIVTGDYTRSGGGLYEATPGSKIVAILPGDRPGSIQNARATIARIRSWPEVQSAIGALTWTMTREEDGPRRRGQPAEVLSIIGIDGDPSVVPGLLVLDAGRWVRGGNEAVVGPMLARGKALHLGDALRLNGATVTVVGIGNLRGFTAFGQAGVAYMDHAALIQRAQLANVVNVIAIQTQQPDRVAERLNDLGGLSSWRPQELVQQAQQANASGIAIDWVLIVLTLGIAGLLVSTTLSHSVTERRAEFAVLRAIGFPGPWIVLTVALEAVTITVAAALGAVSGVFPARKAASVDPVEVLREV